MKKILFAAVILAMSLANPLQAESAIIYSSFGPADGLSAFGQYGVGDLNGTGSADQAAAFTSSSDFVFSSVELAFQNQFDTSNIYNIFIADDSSGVPGNVIESFTVTNFPTFPTTQITTLNSLLNPTLMANTQYWLVALPQQGSAGLWSVGDPGVIGTVAVRNQSSGFEWNPRQDSQPAFRINSVDSTAAVPEPATMALFVSGLIGAGFRKKYKS